MKTRKPTPPELTLGEKLKNVRRLAVERMQGKAEIESTLELRDHGIDPWLLTDELLLAADLEPWQGMSTLLILALSCGHSQIPEKVLRPRLVLTHNRYRLCGSSESDNLLTFCAKHGSYRWLPKKYQTRAAILHRSRRGIHDTPLLAAAKGGNLYALPLKTLKCGDVDDETISSAWSKDHLEYIAHLLTAEQLLRAPFDRHFSCSVLSYLVWHGHLEKVPPGRVVHEYPRVLAEVKDGLKRLEGRKSTALFTTPQLKTEALTWLAEVSKLRLTSWQGVNQPHLHSEIL